MSITASATSAPGTIWWARLGETPGSVGELVGGHRDQLAGSTRAGRRAAACAATSGPSPDGAAPQIRASERNVFEVAAARSGGAAAQQVAGVAGDVGADLLAQRADRRLVRRRRRRSSSRASRAAPSGSDQATSGASSAPPAISSEPPPMSKTASRPADQPNQRRTARKVSRASSSPGSTSIATPVSLGDVVEHLVAVGGVAHRRGREAEHVLAALVLGDHDGVGDERGQRVDPASGVTAPSVEVLGEPQRLLVGVRRQRRRAAVGVDHEQVAGVGADVEHAQAHGSNYYRSAHAVLGW